MLVVERSGALSRRLDGVFGGDVVLEGSAVTPAELLGRVRVKKPSVALIELSGNSSEVQKAIEGLMAEAPVPVVLVVEPEHRALAFPLLATGALDVIELPAELDEAFAERFRKQLRLLATVRVVRHPKGRRRRSSARIPAVKPSYPLVAIASSLGGPKALAELLGGIAPTLGAPIVICQHITAGFTQGLAQWLKTETGLKVQEAANGQRLVKGEVFIAPSRAHLVVQATGLLKLDDAAEEGGFRPSCDVLLRSAAASFGSTAIGVILTGMGRDGAQGLLEVRQRGGHTVAQDRESCAVFGMPKEAIALGAAETVLPLGQIAGQITRLVAELGKS